MRKSILVLASVVAVGAMAYNSAAEARGLRIGLGFGVPFGRSGLADPTILQRAEQRVEENRYRRAGRVREVVIIDRRQAAFSAARARQEKAAVLAAAASAKREAAAAQAQARADKVAAAKAEARKASLAAKPATLPTQVAAPAVNPAALTGGDTALLAAQQQQKAKADEMLKSLERPGQASAPDAERSRAPPGRLRRDAVRYGCADGAVRSGCGQGYGSGSADPGSRRAPAKSAPAGDCRRFIPAAGITMTVPCTE